MSSNSSIDIIIPAYNAENTILEAIESIQTQSFPNFRAIIIDDGSTDQTASLLAEVAKKDHRIEIFSTPNRGVANALNYGLSRCSSRFVARFDADDIAYPQRLEVQRAYLLENPDCVAVGCDVDHIDEAGSPLIGYPRPGDPGKSDPSHVPAREPYIIHPFLLARRSAIDAVGGYRELATSQDTDLYWRLSEHGRLHNLPQRLGKYRIHANSVSGAKISKGRVMALCSQLSAISASRVRDGKTDLKFPISSPLFKRTDVTLEELLAVFEHELTESELQYLRLAMGAKLMEMASYREYELELSDCRFIASSTIEGLSIQNARELQWYRTVTASRLMRKRRIYSAFVLAGHKGLLTTLARTLLQTTEVKR